ncbi:DUF418 domain-containing protein [soil metagenome]
MNISAGPVAVRERVGSLDVLRGVAVCGILLMNIPLMGMIGDLDRPPLPAVPNLDWIAYSIQDTVFAGSMRGLFTLLFGAGMLIMLRRADDPEGGESIQAYITRCFALMLLGVANFALFLWPGEILFNYGVVGLGLILFRKAKTRVLLTAAAAAVLVLMTVALATPSIDRAETLRGVPAAEAAKAAGKTLTKEQEASLGMQARIKENLNPPAAKVEKERVQRTSFPGVVAWSTKFWVDFNFGDLAVAFLGESLGFMLIGMALFRSGVLSGAKSLRFYALLAVCGYALGFAVRGSFLFAEWTTGFMPNPEQMVWRGWIYELGRLPTTLGLLGLIMVLFKTGALGKLAGAIQAIGRMALTNYVGQSVITAIIFYAFGLVGKFGFAQLMGIAALIWIFQGLFSVLWLKRYEMGPLEWGLRMLTYGQITPLPRVQPSAAVGSPVAAPAE